MEVINIFEYIIHTWLAVIDFLDEITNKGTEIKGSCYQEIDDNNAK